VVARYQPSNGWPICPAGKPAEAGRKTGDKLMTADVRTITKPMAKSELLSEMSERENLSPTITCILNLALMVPPQLPLAGFGIGQPKSDELLGLIALDENFSGRVREKRCTIGET
jgi:hypothetical protein